MRLTRTPLLIESIVRPPVKRLHIFDFDGTLAKSPGPSRENFDLYRYNTRSWTHPRGKNIDGWWGNPNSLQHPFEVPPIESTLKDYHAAKRDKHGRVIIMTGRVNTPGMRDAVSGVLHRFGIHGHEHGKNLFLKPPAKDLNKKKVKRPADAISWKAHMLDQLHQKYPELRRVNMWDDHPEYLDQYREHLAKRGLRSKMTHVQAPDWEWNKTGQV